MFIVHYSFFIRTATQRVVPGRVELPTSTLSVWRSNQLSYRTGWRRERGGGGYSAPRCWFSGMETTATDRQTATGKVARIPSTTGIPLQGTAMMHPKPRAASPTRDDGALQKGGVPAAPSGTATLLRLSPNHQFYPRPVRPQSSGTPGFHGLTGGVYKARERIHRAMADARLLANPASWSRVADSSPN